MQYAYMNGEKVTPFPKGKGTCGVCSSDTIAKCGEKVMWHWAHKSKMDCDPWWENETQWHRDWKEHFPESFREVVHQCDVTGEKHRADIKSDKGIILEIQNSPISLEELRSRENFYKNMIWIVNGEKFRPRFKVFKTFLPNPECRDFDDIVFMSTNNEHSCTMYWKKSENPHALNNSKNEMVRIHSTRKILKKMNDHYIGHHPFYWQRPHIAWMEAKCPVFIDFGTDLLWKIENYRGQFRCVRAVGKEEIVSNIINKESIHSIANNYTVLSEHRKKA